MKITVLVSKVSMERCATESNDPLGVSRRFDPLTPGLRATYRKKRYKGLLRFVAIFEAAAMLLLRPWGGAIMPEGLSFTIVDKILPQETLDHCKKGVWQR